MSPSELNLGICDLRRFQQVDINVSFTGWLPVRSGEKS